MISDYRKAVDILTSQGKFHICLGLERISKILELLSNPQDKLKIIHVAGTNGKGSVCAILANILMKQGYKVGLYTSPHIFEYTERIKIDNNDISETDFSLYILTICKIAQQNDIYLTEFEILTAAAYKYFFDNKIDIAIVETGLGGRLDATNAYKNSLFSIITSISIDHVDRLGDSVEKIAFEKAGIIRESNAVIVSEDNQGYEILKSVAAEKKSMIVTPKAISRLSFEGNKNYVYVNNKKYEFSLLGLWQEKNLNLVFEAINLLDILGFKISENAIIEGLKTVNWPCRFQYIREKNIIIDGAHNYDAAKQLLSSIDSYFPNYKKIWIYGSLNTKEYQKIASLLFKEDDQVYFYKFDNKNAISLKDIESCTKNNIIECNLPESENILNYYCPNSLKIVSGSFYMMKELFKKL